MRKVLFVQSAPKVRVNIQLMGVPGVENLLTPIPFKMCRIKVDEFVKNGCYFYLQRERRNMKCWIRLQKVRNGENFN